jgi:large subunit ribosomal protein L23
MDNIIIKPLLTDKWVKANEKAELHNANLAGKLRGTKRKNPIYHKEKSMVYAFFVRKDVNKTTIKRTIEAFYNVKVEAVRTQVYVGKRVIRQTTKGLSMGRKKAGKKAIVQLKKGEVIDFFAEI